MPKPHPTAPRVNYGKRLALGQSLREPHAGFQSLMHSEVIAGPLELYMHISVLAEHQAARSSEEREAWSAHFARVLPDFRAQGIAVLEQYRWLAFRRGFAVADEVFVLYALCALIDEAVLNLDPTLAALWTPCMFQTHFFQETRAGDGFFTRLKSLRGQADKVALLELYYFCLVLGFSGRYRVREDEPARQALIREVGRELSQRGIMGESVLLERARRVPVAVRSSPQRRPLYHSLTAAASAMLLWLGLSLAGEHQVSRLGAEVAAATSIDADIAPPRSRKDSVRVALREMDLDVITPRNVAR